MKRVFRYIHLWLSIPFGLIIALICFSGAALVFEDEVMELCRHDLYYVKKVESSPLPMDTLLAKVAATLPDSVSITGVAVSSNPERAYQVNLSKPRRASIYVDPYTAEVKGKNERAPFFYAMFRLHRWLLDGMKADGGIFWGKMIVGVSTLMFIIVLISGVVIWWPRNKKILKNSLKIKFTKGWHRFWYDSHVAGGLYTLILLLVMSVTGLTWSFSWYRTGFYKLFGVETSAKSGGHGHGGGDTKEKDKEKGKDGDKGHSPFAHWQQVYDQLRIQNADYKQITLSKGSATVSFNQYGNQRAADRYAFHPRSGEITETTLYKDADASAKIRGWIYSVHVGEWGGMLTRILTFIAAVIGGTLPLTGYYFWLRRLSRKKK